MRGLAGVVSFLVLCGVAGCASRVPSSSPAAHEMTLVLEGGSFSSLCPYSDSLANRQLGALLFRGLARPTAQGVPSPDLLRVIPTKDNGGISRDGRHVTLHLRAGATWQDGAPITMDDVAFTLSLLRNGTLVDDPQLGYKDISSVAVDGPDSMRLTLSTPNSPLVWGMVPYVLPRHLLAKEPVIFSARYWLRPVGSGSYRVVSAIPGREARLSPVTAGATPLRVVFAQTSDEASRAYATAPVAAWVGRNLGDGTSGDSTLATSTGVWRAWVFRSRANSIWTNAGLRRHLLALIPREGAATTPTIDPFGMRFSPRSLAASQPVAAYMRKQGWKLGAGKPPRRAGRAMTLTFLMPSPTDATVAWFDATRASLGSLGIVFGVQREDPPNVGGFFDGDPLTAAGRTHDFDFAYTNLYLGWPAGAEWPLRSSDAPSWKNPFGGNVFRVREPQLDAAYGAVLNAGNPESALAAWQQTGRKLKELNIVSWEYPVLNKVRFKGIEGVEVSPYSLTVLGSVPEWRPRAQ